MQICSGIQSYEIGAHIRKIDIISIYQVYQKVIDPIFTLVKNVLQVRRNIFMQCVLIIIVRCIIIFFFLYEQILQNLVGGRGVLKSNVFSIRKLVRTHIDTRILYYFITRYINAQRDITFLSGNHYYSFFIFEIKKCLDVLSFN